jgi:NTE family protein
MNKLILTFILLLVPFSLAHTTPRKKVGIVLSGGGAKGVAHIGAIKVLEELDIPIDYIAGTSIGAIIGGLYSIGYTSEQLEVIVKQTNWIDLLTDKISRDAIPFPFKLDDSKYLISLPIKYNQRQKYITVIAATHRRL